MSAKPNKYFSQGPPRPQATIVRHEQATLTTHSGPLPDPDDLRDYNTLIPNGAERIMALAEREQKHRHRTDGLGIMTSATAQVVGTACAFVVAIAALGLAFWLFREGKNGAGFVSMLTPLAGLVGAIVWAKKK